MSASGPTDREVRRHFAGRAPTYGGGGDESLRAIAELAQLAPGSRVLDVATGTGAVAFGLAGELGSPGRVIGVDFTAAMLARALERRSAVDFHSPERQVQFAAADAARLPFPTDTFDIVTCRLSVPHFTAPEAAVQEMGRVLRPGGRLVIGEFQAPEEPEKAAYFNRLERLRSASHVEAFSETRLRAMMSTAGYPVVEVRYLHRGALLSEWLSSTTITPENTAEIRQLVWESLDGDLAGLSPQRQGVDLRLTRQDIVLQGRRRAVPGDSDGHH